MHLIYNTTAFLQQLCISFFLFSLLCFISALKSLAFLVIAPFLCSFVSACLVFKVISLELKFVARLGATVGSTNTSQIASRLKNDDVHVFEQENRTVVLDTRDFSSTTRYEEQEGDLEGFLVQETTDIEDYKSFNEILSFWRKMEEGH